MSSYYTTAQLEEMRKKRLKEELSESINKLREQLKIEHKNSVQMTEGTNIVMTVFDSDDAIGGYCKNVAVTGSMLQHEEGQDRSKHNELDFSGLLFSANKRPTKLELELDSWVKKVDERPVVSEKDEKDRTRLLAELAKIIHTSEMDIEDKISSIKMRVSSYLLGAVRLTDSEKEKLEATYFEYLALCKLLEVVPTESVPYRVEKEVARMTSVLEKRRQDEYIMAVVEEIMEELGCHVKDDAVLDHTIGQMFSVDGHPLCDVFIGNDGNGIMFEPVGESREGSLERRRQVESSANSICSLYSELEERAAEKGVILKRVYAEPVEIEKMCIQTDISERSSKKHQRKTVSQKKQALTSED